jgi:hypothetical protein
MYYFRQRKGGDKIDAIGILANSEITVHTEVILLPIFQDDLILLPIFRHKVGLSIISSDKCDNQPELLNSFNQEFCF